MTGYVAVIDYGMGNLHSVASALEHAGAPRVEVSHDPQVIAAADRVVFPGVGAIRDCMAEIRRLGCDRLLQSVLDSKRQPVLAICVGMQALMEHSEENDGVATLGFIPGRVNFFGTGLTSADGERLKVPHMGWNQVRQTRQHPMWRGIADGSRFYFVHSYYFRTKKNANCIATTNYPNPITAAVLKENIFGTQFHPEKSHHNGKQIIRNFLEWVPS